MLFRIPDWNGAPLSVARSRGGSSFAVTDVDRNMVKGSVQPWPSPELLQKLCAAARSGSFLPDDFAALTERLGFYCDLQSVNSEDAMTWSYFGLLAHARAETRAGFMEWLLERLSLAEPVDHCSIWLWRRLLHPDKPISLGGPEIDFGIQSGSTVILGEAKWRSAVGKGQGIHRDKDQITLRREILENFGAALFPSVRTFVVLGVGVTPNVVCETQSTLASGARLVVCNMTWADLCSWSGHPDAQEVAAYYEWKRRHS